MLNRLLGSPIFLNGFAHSDKLWHFKADWHALKKTKFVPEENINELPDIRTI